MSEKMVFFFLSRIRTAAPVFINIFPRETIDNGGQIDGWRIVAVYVTSSSRTYS
jgi:hypothetical protein